MGFQALARLTSVPAPPGFSPDSGRFLWQARIQHFLPAIRPLGQFDTQCIYEQEASLQRLTRWGNSVGIRVPGSVLEAAGLKVGDYCEVRLLDSGDIRVRPATAASASAIEPLSRDLSLPTDQEVAAKW